MAITKLVLTVVTSYDAAPASTVGNESWGYVSLWDIRPWLPWDARGLVGPTGWEGYLGRDAVMDSTQSPTYVALGQGPKSWAKQTNTVTIYDSGTYANCSKNGAGPYSYTGDVASTLAYDVSTIQSLIDTIVVSVYAYNSIYPALGGPSATDELKFYGAYLDVTLDTGVTTRVFAQNTVSIAPGPNVGVPTTVINTAKAIDADAAFATFATVQETNGKNGPVGALWHPAVLLLEKWTWGSILCDDPPAGTLGEPYVHTFLLTGGTAPFVWTITAGSLPPGLSMDPATGQVTGIPETAGNYAFTLSVTDASGIAITASCSIRIHERIGWLDLWVWRVLTQFAGTDQVIEFPPGYERAMRLQLAADFGRQYPGHDRARIKAQLARALEALDRENVTQGQAVEDLPESAE
jgi:hypothetical protein